MKKKKLLLVDDEKLILKTLGRGLREKGFAVTTVGNKATAELKLRQNSYDIVVTDLVMEGLDGISLPSSVASWYFASSISNTFETQIGGIPYYDPRIKNKIILSTKLVPYFRRVNRDCHE